MIDHDSAMRLPAPSRRTFLKASGISLGLPMLEAFGKPAESPPRRALFVCNTLGFYSPAFYPKSPGRDYEASEYLALLEEHRDDLTIFSGLSHPDQGVEHQCEMTWLSAARNPGRDGFRNSISLDQFAAGKLGYVTRFPSLSLRVGPGGEIKRLSAVGAHGHARGKPAFLYAVPALEGNSPAISLGEMIGGRCIGVGQPAGA